MEQKEAVMVLFDREEEYARLLSEFLRRQKELPWEIHTYTKMEELLERENIFSKEELDEILDVYAMTK